MKHRLVMTVLAIVASLTLAGSVATARAPAAADRHDATTVAPPSNPHPNEKGDADEQGKNADDQGENDPSNHDRPHNHGWYVSQAAHDKSTTGADHGRRSLRSRAAATAKRTQPTTNRRWRSVDP